jgi:DNA-binding MarR family transcriptional regulator
MEENPSIDLALLSSRLLRYLFSISRFMRGKALLPNISASAILVLGILFRRKSATLTSLAEELHIKKQSLTILVKGLQEKNFIHRKQSCEDARKNVLSLTADGRDIFLHTMLGRRALLESLLMRLLSEEELASLTGALPALEKLAGAGQGERVTGEIKEARATPDSNFAESERGSLF